MEYYARRQLLVNTLEGQEGAIKISEEFDADLESLLVHACGFGLEGIIGKHRDGPHRSGRLSNLAHRTSA